MATTVAATLGSTSSSFAQETAQATSGANAYPAAVTQAYLSNCVSTAENYGLPSSGAQAYCDCTLSEFQNNYTLEQFMAISTSVMQDQAPPEFMEVVNTCLPYLSNS